MLPVRRIPLLGFSCIVILTLAIRWSFTTRPLTREEQEALIVYPPEHLQLLDDLERYGVRAVKRGSAVEIAKLELNAVLKSTFQPPLLQDVDIVLPSSQQVVSKSDLDAPMSTGAKATINATTSPPRADLSSIIFGISTTLERLDDSLDAFVHWASNTNGRILVLVEETAPADLIDRTSKRAKGLNLLIEIVPMALEFDDRYFHLLQALYDRTDERTKWLSFLDDDTFFPSINRLLSLLSKYDASKPHYVGALSEDFHQIILWGLIAYGGAGVFVSLPLAKEVLPHYEACNDHELTGDRRIANCILEYSTTRLTNEPALHQVDLREDGSGFYEALRSQPVSVHHWKSWNNFPMHEIAYVAQVCGEACLYQTFRLQDGWQLTNGISIVKYSYERGINDTRMEKTWRDSQGQPQQDMFRHHLAPIAPKDEGKIQYIMETARYGATKNEVQQIYVRRQEDPRKVSIVEVTWRQAPNPNPNNEP